MDGRAPRIGAVVYVTNIDKGNAFEMKYLSSMAGVTKGDRNKVVRQRMSMKIEIACRVDRSILS